jgi:hypothetical protein
VNLLGDNIDTVKEKATTFINARKDVDLEVNAKKLTICFCSHLTVCPNHDINIANTSFENMTQFSIWE